MRNKNGSQVNPAARIPFDCETREYFFPVLPADTFKNYWQLYMNFHWKPMERFQTSLS